MERNKKKRAAPFCPRIRPFSLIITNLFPHYKTLLLLLINCRANSQVCRQIFRSINSFIISKKPLLILCTWRGWWQMPIGAFQRNDLSLVRWSENSECIYFFVGWFVCLSWFCLFTFYSLPPNCGIHLKMDWNSDCKLSEHCTVKLIGN